MQPTIPSGRHLALNANLTGSRFEDVNLKSAEFDNVNLTGATFHNINLSDIKVSAAQMGGAHFKHIGCPPDPDGGQVRQRGVIFEEMSLNDSTFRKVDLSNVSIVDCDITRTTIDGILISELLSAYRNRGQ